MRAAAAAAAICFADGAAYERFMGDWSRAAGTRFLRWVAPPACLRWLEIGCGTGAFTQLLTRQCQPASIVALDAAPAQIAYAQHCASPAAAAFVVAAGEALPFRDHSFDAVASALTMNFIAGRSAAMREMYRVTRAGGTIAAYVWDFATDRTPHAPIVRGLRRIGLEACPVPGAEICAPAGLQALWAEAGLVDVETTALDITVGFTSFAVFWDAQTPSFSPTTRLIRELDRAARIRLIEAVRDALPLCSDGSIAYPARVNAVKGRVGS